VASRHAAELPSRNALLRAPSIVQHGSVSAPVDAALAAVRAVAAAARGTDRRLAAVDDADTLIDLIASHARITLNFHPDRLLPDGRSVAESLAADGIYRSQYETGVTAGSRSAFLGGERDTWERGLFGDHHHATVTPADRPKYGALNLAHVPDGAAPRFGSAHVRLRPAVSRRATFTVGDSHLGPVDIGTIDEFRMVLGGFLHRPTADGTEIAALRALADADRRPPADNGRQLDDYIEAQVHGVVDVGTDAEAVVLDPSFRGTEVERLFVELTGGLGIGLDWHPGYGLRADAVTDHFRGPEIPPFARAVGDRFGGGWLDARIIGLAAAETVREPGAWARLGGPDDLLQRLKRVWHTVVTFGVPSDGAMIDEHSDRVASTPTYPRS
jgi:hypothetical protein